MADLGPNQLDRAVLLNATTGQKALYGLPMGQISDYVHVCRHARLVGVTRKE